MKNDKHYSGLSSEEFYRKAADLLFHSFKSDMEIQNESKE